MKLFTWRKVGINDRNIDDMYLRNAFSIHKQNYAALLYFLGYSGTINEQVYILTLFILDKPSAFMFARHESNLFFIPT